jgi:ABC-2 type transport system ATP-binding protein
MSARANDGLAPSIEPAVELAGVTYRFGEHVAVDDLDLTVRRGEMFGLLGPNGAGKTTTIRLLNTLLPLQDGAIHVFGLDVRRNAMAIRRLLGYVPQQLSIEGALTGRENVAWFARLYDVPRRERAARVAEVLEMVDLSEAADRLAATFSGGMVRRLELAQALVNRPALLVLDEPTVGLDPVLRRDLWDLFHGLAEHGTTLLVSSHVMDEAGRCNELILLRDGRLVAYATPDELRARTGADDLDTAFLRIVEEAA